MEQAKSAIDIENLWTYFKENLLSTVGKHVPSQLSRTKKNLPWVNRKIRKQLKKNVDYTKQQKLEENETSIGSMREK